MIHAIACEGRIHLTSLVAPDPTWIEKRERANAQYARLRLSGQKQDLIRSAEAILGPHRDLPDELRASLCSTTGYSPALLAACYFAAHHASTRAEFERLLGLHGSAYPSLLRSEVHHHAFRHRRKSGVTWTEFRRAIRFLYRTFNAHRPLTLPA